MSDPAKLYNYTPVYSGIPPLEPHEYADAGEIVCIKTSEAMIPYLVTIWECLRYDFVIDGDVIEKKHTLEQFKTLLSQIMTAQPCEVCDSCGDKIVYKNDQTTICEDSMSNIIIYQGCGCGCGDEGGNGQVFGGGSSGGGGASGSWLTTPDVTDSYEVANTTQCDVATTIVPYVMQQASEFFLYMENNASNLGDFVDGVANAALSLFPIVGDFGAQGVDWVSDIIDAGAQGARELVSDSDFLLEVQVAYIRAHGADGAVTQLSRQDFLDIVQYLPNVWSVSSAVAFPKVIMDGFFRIMRMSKINTRLPLATGTAFEPLCNYLYSENNQTYTAPTQGTLPAPNPFGESLAWQLDFTKFDTIEESGAQFVSDGMTTIGQFYPGEGVGGLFVGQNNLAVGIAWSGTANVTDIGYELSGGGLGGNPFLRGVYTAIDDISVSGQGPSFNISGQASGLFALPFTPGPGLVFYVNAMNDLSARFGKIIFVFDEPVTMPVGWEPYEE